MGGCRGGGSGPPPYRGCIAVVWVRLFFVVVLVALGWIRCGDGGRGRFGGLVPELVHVGGDGFVSEGATSEVEVCSRDTCIWWSSRKRCSINVNIRWPRRCSMVEAGNESASRLSRYCEYWSNRGQASMLKYKYGPQALLLINAQVQVLSTSVATHH